MTNIVFVKNRAKFDPYVDFFHLAELTGFSIIYVDELDMSVPGIYIVSPYNAKEWISQVESQEGKQRNAHLIHWNIERPSGSAGAVGKYGERQRQLMYDRVFDEVWVSDRRLADETHLRYVTLGSHPDMGQPGKMNEKEYGFTHQSAEIPRRQTIYNVFGKQEVGKNCWPPERDEILKKSKFGMATHQDDHPFLEPLRMSLFAAWGLPIVCETVYDAWPYGADVVRFEHYNHMASTMRRMLNEDYQKWYEMGQKCRERMTTEYEFGEMVRIAVEQTVGDWR